MCEPRRLLSALPVLIPHSPARGEGPAPHPRRCILSLQYPPGPKRPTLCTSMMAEKAASPTHSPAPASASTSTTELAVAMAKTTRSSLPALALSAVAAGVTAAPARVGGGRQGAPTAASIWSSPGSHGVLDEEEEEDAEDEASHFADLDLAASWGAAVEAAVAGLVRVDADRERVREQVLRTAGIHTRTPPHPHPHPHPPPPPPPHSTPPQGVPIHRPVLPGHPCGRPARASRPVRVAHRLGGAGALLAAPAIRHRHC